MNRCVRNSIGFVLILSVFLFVKCGTTKTMAQDQRAGKYAEKSLQERWDRAFHQSEKRQAKNGFWIGYRIKRLMGINSYIGRHGSSYGDEKTLREILDIKSGEIDSEQMSDEESVRTQAKRTLKTIAHRDRSDEKIWKDVAILFQLEPKPKNTSDIQELKMSNLNLSVDLEGLPLVWLGEATDGESISLLTNLFSDVNKEELKEEMVTAVALHEDSELVIPFLINTLKSKESEEIRENAAFWLGQRDHKDALNALVQSAKKDCSIEVREKAVFAISQMDMKAATDELIRLARHAHYRKIREKAIFWLGQKASKRAAEGLGDMVYDQSDTEIQKRAVFAISQLPNDDGIPKLIKIAKTHHNIAVRKKAIFWLGQTKDKRAIDALVKIVRGE